MSYLCPVCNGLFAAQAACPRCSSLADDCGRFNDYIGPYSPYRAIDELGMCNGIADDVRSGKCVHVMECPSCSHVFSWAIPGW